jgi:hypothetical protein
LDQSEVISLVYFYKKKYGKRKLIGPKIRDS